MGSTTARKGPGGQPSFNEVYPVNTFQNFQPVKVNNDKLADHGRAGHVCSTERTEVINKLETRVCDVMLDAHDDDGNGAKPQEAVSIPVDSLQAL